MFVIVNSNTGTKVSHPTSKKDGWDTERGAKLALKSNYKITGENGGLEVLSEEDFRIDTKLMQFPRIDYAKLLNEFNEWAKTA